MEHESFVRTPRECCAVIEARLGRERTEALRRVDGGYTHFPTLDALPEDTARAGAAYGRRCVYCQAADLTGLAIEIDFLVPRERGGSIQAMNLVAACERCRTARRGRHLDAFLARRRDLDARAVYDRIAAASATFRAATTRSTRGGGTA
jgi:5-methylcytosine-specific restriction endonuclease McrA